MTIAVFSDIHGNHLALEACVQEAVRRGVKRFLFLGDYVSGCAYPQKTLAILSEVRQRYECRFIRGNHEEYMLHYRASGEAGWHDGSSSGALLYTYENLKPSDLDWFEDLDFQGKESFPGCPPLAYCHGSFRDARGRFSQDDPATLEMLGELEADLVLCGHTHQRGAYTAGGGWFPEKRVVNPGSLGMSCGTAEQAQMALLHEEGGRWCEELLAVPYDARAAVRELGECGLTRRAPVWTALSRHVILTGESKIDEVLPRARELCRLDTGKAEWPDIPEQYWERAAAEAGLE